jgi:uncharacterized membrane-anchored protein
MGPVPPPDRPGAETSGPTATFSVALVVTFVVWFANERTLSIHSIYTTRREAFYWLAILFTFALGTAAGGLRPRQRHTRRSPGRSVSTV